MTPPLALRLGVALLVADGVAALYLADFLDARGVLVMGLLLLAGWGAQGRRRATGAGLPALRVVVPVAAVASLLDVLYLAETVLDALVRVLLFLALVKIATARTVADTRVTGFLAFFMLVAASVSAFGVGYLLVVVSFLLLGTWVAMTQHQLMEAAAAPGATAGSPARGPLGLAVLAAALVLVVTAGFFLVLPRVGLAALPFRARPGPAVSGFSEDVALGAYGSIVASTSVAMRVHLPDGEDPTALPGLRWRGIALDTFDGRRWSVRHPRRIRAVLPGSGEFEVGEAAGTGHVLRQEVYLEPIGAEVLFAAPHAWRIRLPAGVLLVDDMESIAVTAPGGRLRYQVESEIEAPGPRGRRARPAPALDPAVAARHLQLPPLSPRIPALAREVAGDAAEPHEAAARLLAFFAREFRYTLDLGPVTGPEPLEEFLFGRRAGHCEYFAAAMTVMLRSLGVPARLVNGFQRGEWNPYGRYFLVRLLDAHSWVEAHLPGDGWVTLDPTPRASVAAFATAGPVWLYLDAVRLGWQRYVIGWSLSDQARTVETFQARAIAWTDWLWSAGARVRAVPGGALLAAAGLLVLGLAWRRRSGGGRGAGESAAPVPGFYGRALARLGRRGLHRAPQETAREFAARVARLDAETARVFARITTAYERTRFAGQGPAPAERLWLRAAARRLGARRRPVAPP